jgi:glucose uptake protein GlcU
MGASSKVLSVILRLGELSCSVIVLGLVGRVLWHVGQANTYSDARLVFVTVVACISTVASLLLMAPFTFSFFACPFDLVLFVLWLVAFILLELASIPVMECGTIATGVTTGLASGERPLL